MVPQYTDLYVKNKKPGDPETALKMPYHQGDISSPLLLKVHLKNAQAVMYLFKRLFLMPEDKILWVSSEFGKSYKLHRYVLIDCLSGTTPPRFLTRKTFRQRFLSTPSPNVVHTDLAKGHHLEEDGPYQPPPVFVLSDARKLEDFAAMPTPQITCAIVTSVPFCYKCSSTNHSHETCPNPHCSICDSKAHFFFNCPEICKGCNHTGKGHKIDCPVARTSTVPESVERVAPSLQVGSINGATVTQLDYVGFQPA